MSGILASPSVVPYLFYDDVDCAARFLEDAFGFQRVFESPDPAGGLARAQLEHGTGKVMLGKIGPGLRPVASAQSLNALHGGVYVYVDDVDAHCDRARAAGAEVLLNPSDQVDVEGQFWMFARRLK